MNYMELNNQLLEDEVTSTLSNGLGGHRRPTTVEDFKRKKVTISNVDVERLKERLSDVYGSTTRTAMWDKCTDTTLSFDSWFVPDLIWMLEHLLAKSPDPALHMEDAAKFTIGIILEQLRYNTWYSSVIRPIGKSLKLENINKRLKWKPLKHQKEYFDQYERGINNFGFRGGLAAFAPGLGKSYTALAIAEALDAELVIVLAPKSTLRDPWEVSLSEIYKKVPTFWSPLQKRKLRKSDRFVIINYESAGKVLDELLKMHSPKRLNNALLILDESHNVNNVDSKRSDIYLRFMNELTTRAIALSGTPIKAMREEIIPLLYAIDPLFTPAVEEKLRKVAKHAWGPAGRAFTNRINLYMKVVGKESTSLKPYQVKTQSVYFKDAEEFTLPAIQEKMRLFSEPLLIRYIKERPEYLAEYWKTVRKAKDDSRYPEFERGVSKVIATTNYRPVYHLMKSAKLFEDEVVMPLLSPEEKERFKYIRAIAKYPRLKVVGETLGTILTAERIRCNIAVARAVNYDAIIESSPGKTLIFSNNIKVLESAIQSMPTRHCLNVSGDHVKRLPDIVKAFTVEPHLNPLVASYQALSTGVPVTVASEVVILDSPFRDYILNQAISRAHRLGNDKLVTVWYIQLDTGEIPNLNTRSLEIAQWSSEEVADILGIDPSTEFPMQALSEFSDELNNDPFQRGFKQIKNTILKGSPWGNWS